MQQLVNRNRARAEQFKRLGAGRGQFGFAHLRHGWGTKFVARWLLQGLRSFSSKGFDNDLSPLHQGCAVTDQAVAVAVARIQRPARHREHFTALFASQVGGYE